jgi:hypothetical protein
MAGSRNTIRLAHINKSCRQSTIGLFCWLTGFFVVEYLVALCFGLSGGGQVRWTLMLSVVPLVATRLASGLMHLQFLPGKVTRSRFNECKALLQICSPCTALATGVGLAILDSAVIAGTLVACLLFAASTVPQYIAFMLFVFALLFANWILLNVLHSILTKLIVRSAGSESVKSQGDH